MVPRHKDINKLFIHPSLASLLRLKKTQYIDQPLLPIDHYADLRIFTSTVLRGSENNEITGYLMEIDWRNNQAIKKIPIPTDTSHPLWNPRGGNRGGRGIVIHDGFLYMATAMSVLKYDRYLNQVGEIVHPHLGGLHEIVIDDGGIWLTSTIHDLVIKIDFDGNILDEWWGSENRILQSELGYSGRDLNVELDFPKETFSSEYARYCAEERLHVNTVWTHSDEVFVLSCSKNAFIKIRPEPEQIILQDNNLESPHNGIVSKDNRIIINDTKNQCIRTYEFSSGKHLRTIDTMLYDEKSSMQFAKAGWQRGLTHIEGSIYLVGTSPATIFEVDIDKGVIGQICRIDIDVKHCIHGLAATRDF